VNETRATEAAKLPIWSIVLLGLPLGFSANFLGEPMPWQDWVLEQIVANGQLSRLDRFAANVSSTVFLPWLAAVTCLLVLRAQRWLVMSPLALGACATAAAVLLGFVALGILRAAHGLAPYFAGDAVAVARWLLLLSVSIALGATLMQTGWRRIPRHWQQRLSRAWNRMHQDLRHPRNQ
jgi:hypothetical protein